MIKSNFILDAKGLACPIPIVKTKKAISNLNPGQVMEVQATDKGSLADIKAWAKSSGHHYLGSTEKGDILRHYLRKAHNSEVKEEKKYPHVIHNKELQKKLDVGANIIILDVREPAEFAFGHIPGAKSIPLGELEERLNELDKDSEIYVVCRTGNRSDLASNHLSEKGFRHVKNVIQGMVEWEGIVAKVQ